MRPGLLTNGPQLAATASSPRQRTGGSARSAVRTSRTSSCGRSTTVH
ncbi:MAG: hypothetical protein WA441_14025 [Methyloceanibacter sp.]